MTSLWIFAAFGTATCFAVSNLFAYDAARALGAVKFSFVRMSLVALGFAALLAITGFDPSIEFADVKLLILSGISGVFLADTFRYSSLARVGPALQSLLATTTAPFTLLLGFVVLGQVVGGLPLLGTAIVFAGILLAVISRNSEALTRFSGAQTGLGAGILFGLAGALTQSGSILIAAPVMLKGVDPISATFVRSAAGSASLILPALFTATNGPRIGTMSQSIVRQVLLSAVVGTGLGMTLQLYALRNGPAGIVSTLSATTPLIILPLIWIVGKSRPHRLAWIGAVFAVVGVGVIVNSG